MSTNLPFGTIDVENRGSGDVNRNEPLDAATNRFPTENLRSAEPDESVSPVDLGRDPDLWLYRERTIALLKRYLRFSIEVGRLPSILGRELFRSKVTSYRMSSFEDAVIFVHDVEQALDQLDALSKDLIAMIIFQDYSQDEAANTLRCARRTVCRLFPEAVDTISELFLEGGQLNRLPVRRAVENSCQEGESTRFSANACKQAE
jgi:predicted DNA-binding protein (UPF0251 family)